VPLRAHARQGRAVAAGHRPCRHRHADGGRAPARSAGARPPRDGPRGLRRARLGVEGRIRRHHHQPAEAARRLLRLVARALHHGRGPVAAVLKVFVELYKRGADLQGQAAGQLGPEAADRDLRPRGRAGRGQGHLWHLRYPIEGEAFDPPTRTSSRRDDAARDDAGRHRVAVHPDDERYKHLVGKHVDPAAGRPRIPIVATSMPIPRRAPAR
jgi:hypothetical protein